MRLRQWRDEDLVVFAQLNADPEVMRYFPATLSVEQSDALAHRCRSLIAQQGWGLWALEEKASAAFIGFTGLNIPADDLPCSPCVEIGWRLVKGAWGNGFVSEAARTCLSFAFESLALEQVVSFTAVENARSRAVMTRLGMTDTQRNFAHPALAPTHPLSEHVLYDISRQAFEAC